MVSEDEHRAAALVAVRVALQERSERSGRLPTLGEVTALLRQHGLDSAALDALLGPAKNTGPKQLPHPKSETTPLNADASQRQRARPHESAERPTESSEGPGNRPVEIPPATDVGPGVVPAPDASDDWNDEDPFAPTNAPRGRPSSENLDPSVARLAADLQDDYERSGALTLVDVTSLAKRRGLASDDVEALLLVLAEARVELTEERSEPVYDGLHDLDGGHVRRQVTSVERDQLSAYLAAASRIRLLTAEQEVRLGRAIRAGHDALEALTAPVQGGHPETSARYAAIIETGRRAHRDLVSANLRLVVSIAKLPRYSRSGVELPDRIQDGNTGLMRAADKFDPELGYKFSTYATWWIRQSIDRGAGDRGRAIRLPVHMYEQAKRVRAVQARLTGQLERPVTLGELAAELGQDAGHVAAVLAWSQPILSYDTLVGDDEDISLLDLLVSNTEDASCMDPAIVVLSHHLQADISRVLAAVLTSRELEILQRRYGLDGREVVTLDEIGDQFGVSRERIRQVQSKAMTFLRSDPRVDCLYEYLVDHALADVLTSPLEPRETPPPKRREPRKMRTAGRGANV